MKTNSSCKGVVGDALLCKLWRKHLENQSSEACSVPTLYFHDNVSLKQWDVYFQGIKCQHRTVNIFCALCRDREHARSSWDWWHLGAGWHVGFVWHMGGEDSVWGVHGQSSNCWQLSSVNCPSCMKSTYLRYFTCFQSLIDLRDARASSISFICADVARQVKNAQSKL